MDNDTKKILLLIARALQASALAQLASANRFDVWRKDIAEERAISAALFAKIENEEKQREAAEKYMDEIYRKGDEAAEKHKEEFRSKVGNEENNNA